LFLIFDSLASFALYTVLLIILKILNKKDIEIISKTLPNINKTVIK
jgi:hypothetical protein